MTRFKPRTIAAPNHIDSKYIDDDIYISDDIYICKCTLLYLIFDKYHRHKIRAAQIH